MHLDYEMDEESVAYSIGTGQRTIQFDDGTLLNLAETAIYNDPLGKYLFNSGDSILVFPDSVCENLHLARTCKISDFVLGKNLLQQAVILLGKHFRGA